MGCHTGALPAPDPSTFPLPLWRLVLVAFPAVPRSQSPTRAALREPLNIFAKFTPMVF